MSRILMIGSEAVPFVKTGRLAAVLDRLPPALARAGHDVAVVIPKYRKVDLFGAERVFHELPVWLGGHLHTVAVDRVTDRGVQFLFVNCPWAFDREGIYNVGNNDYYDNHIRFALFSRAAIEVARRVFRPDVIHAHDWQASLTAPYLKTSHGSDPTFFGVKTVLTIHNLGYQGQFALGLGQELGLDPAMLGPGGPLEFHGSLNFLKSGIVFADAISTVSKAYAGEIQTAEFGFGLDGLLRSRADVLSGILNGVDYSEWNPEHDRYIPRNYSADALEGKKECKRSLLGEFGLPEENMERPLIGIVSRFASQKGFDLVAEVARGLVDLGASLAVLGSGDPGYENMFRGLAAWRPDRVGLRIGYDNPLSHRIEAGADMFLMPSRYEPCGLNQIYSLRYGTIPIVRATGGLDDTIKEGTGFKFWSYAGHDLYECIRVAVQAYEDREGWTEMMVRAMREDFSWDVSAREYGALYDSLVKPAAGGVAA